MDDPDDPSYRSLRHRATGEEIHVRESEEIDEEDGVFEVRMPIASTGEVRNEGDDPLTRSELEGFARQINERSVPVFPGHGSDSTIANGQYSPFERLGDWREGEFEVRSADGDDGVLMATARMPDPESLPQATGQYREGLAILKEQAKRGIAQDASIGWRGDESFAGGNDLMEASIVGIGADWRTNTGDDAAEVVAREAAALGVDPDALADRVRDAARGEDPDDARPFGPPGGDPNKWEDFDECVADVEDWDNIDDPEAFCGWAESQTKDTDRAEYEVGDETVEITPPDYMVNAADLAMQKSDEGLGSDCGTGVGDERADQIRNDEVGPDVVAEIAAYLTSHEADVTAGGTPDSWSDEEWDDCGNMQYAKWGGLGTGTALDWAQARANAVADARDEDLPYPSRNLDDPAFGEGDAVSWDWQGDTVHGRVADMGAEFTVGGNTITGEEGEAVYLIHEWDDGVEAFREENVAKPESSLSESTMDMPAATEDNFASMTDDNPPDDGGTTEAQDADDGETTETRAPADIDEADVAEFVSETYEGVDAADIQTVMDDAGAEFTGLTEDTVSWFFADILDITAGEVMEMLEAAEGDEQGEGMDEEEGEDDDEGRDLAAELDQLRDELQQVRSGETDVETPGKSEPDEEQDADDPDGERDTESDEDETDTETRDGPNWRA